MKNEVSDIMLQYVPDTAARIWHSMPSSVSYRIWVIQYIGNQMGDHVGEKTAPITDKHPITDCRLPITVKLPHVCHGEAGTAAALCP